MTFVCLALCKHNIYIFIEQFPCFCQVFSHASLLGHWDDVMRQQGFTTVLAHLRTDCSLPVRYACALVMAVLAQHRVYATLILSTCLPLMTSLRAHTSDLKVCLLSWIKPQQFVLNNLLDIDVINAAVYL